MYHIEEVVNFLKIVDNDFPVSLSQKTDIELLAKKYCEHGTVCCAYDNHRIIAMVVGYIENTVNQMGYISLVASVREARRLGLASKLVREFLEKAEEKHLTAVHVYTHITNYGAIAMYEKLGFVRYSPENEPRPNDVHFFYFFSREKE